MGATAELINISKLAERFKAHRSTIKDFIEYLEKAFLFIILQKFSFSSHARLDSFKKCHALDTGFANLLPIRFSPDYGKLLETMVCIELQRRFDHIYYWRNRHECDFIVQNRDGGRQAIQVCYQLTLDNLQREVNGLTEAANLFSTRKNLIVDHEPEIAEPAAGIDIVSVAEWLSFPPSLE
jgi:predicted AAA+ superfamily ATPase